VPLARVGLDADYLGDDLAGFLDDHRVAEADVLPLELIGVVQAGALDRRAGQEDRLEFGDRRQLARLADPGAGLPTPGHRLLGLVLECNRPARALTPRAQPLALVQVVNLDN